MSYAIKIGGISESIVDGQVLASFSFYVDDGENIVNDAVFYQTEDLTEAAAGITEYGMLVFNTVNSDLESDVTIGCLVGTSEVEATIALGNLLTDGELGASLDELVDEGGGGD